MLYKTKRKRDQELTADVLKGELDLQALAKKHAMSLRELATWVMSDDVFRSLTALCVLADFQTQFILSQHRVTAAAALIHMASGDGTDVDLQRKACVDVLRVNMPRVDPPVAASDGAPPQAMPVDALRKLVYGEQAIERT